MQTPVSAGEVNSLEDNGDKDSLEENLMVLGVVASRFFIFLPPFPSLFNDR